MKKYLFLSMAFISTLAFVGCNHPNEEEIVNDGSKIKTQFAINIGSGSQTRMSGDVAQTEGTFRGMEKIVLASFANFSLPTTGTQLNVSTVAPASLISLGDIETGISASSSSKTYTNVSLPLNTNLFIFYAKAMKGSEEVAGTFADGVAKKLYYGDITYNMSPLATPVAFGGEQYFQHNNIAVDATFSSSAEATALLAAMNAIATVESPVGTPAIETLAMNFTGSPAGSSKAILERVNTLLKAIHVDGTVVQNAARDAIYGLFGSNAAVQAVFNYTAPAGVTPASVTFNTTSLTNIDNFPKYYGLPDGAAILSWSGSAFSYITNGTVGVSVIATPILKFVYPSELTYYVASPVKASASSATTWSVTPADWQANPSTSVGTWGDKVLATSKTVALQNNINYGVAQFKTSVKAGTSPLTYTDPDDGVDKSVAIGAETLPWTAILVGGQPASVGYNFLATENYDRVVVDYPVDIKATTSEPTKFNYTLLFDNYQAGASTKVVNVALEFENNTDKAMKGIDGTVYPGQKFYVIGQLDAENKGETIAWGSIYSSDASIYFPAYPAENTQEAKRAVERVFVQDFTTTANFTISSLKNIYVTIPDLRATQLQFGLSVDLAWKSGLTFDVTID